MNRLSASSVTMGLLPESSINELMLMLEGVRAGEGNEVSPGVRGDVADGIA